MTTIRLTDTAARAKRDFVPIDPANVRVYQCGPTVYDRAHLGNARPAAVYDVLYRLLRHVYGPDHVTFVRNFTDIDDKINARAAATGRDIREITDETIAWYLEDMQALGCLEPTHMPRATDYVTAMKTFIAKLIVKGAAYEAEGHVLFSVAAFPDYGALSGRSTDDMIAGARVEVAPFKRDPMDFILWKPSDPGTPGWESDWGYGRPGWHIECSAMAQEILGETFDIHTGGLDLQFPHHENEIAQSRALLGCESFAQCWLHNEMLQVEGRKMSKSLGNFFTVRELIDAGHPGEVIRFVLLSTHYRSPMDWTDAKAREAALTLERWSELLASYSALIEEPPDPAAVDPDALAALCDDLNTPKAISVLHRLARAIADRDPVSNDAHFEHEQTVRRLLATADLLLGLQVRAFARAYLASERFMSTEERLELEEAWVAATIKGLIEDRRLARLRKDFARADTIRDDLAAAGVEIRDGKDGTTWSLEPGFDPARLEALG